MKDHELREKVGSLEFKVREIMDVLDIKIRLLERSRSDRFDSLEEILDIEYKTQDPTLPRHVKKKGKKK